MNKNTTTVEPTGPGKGGIVVAICAGGPRQKEALEPLASYWEPLPPGTFHAAGTGVNTVLLTIEVDN